MSAYTPLELSDMLDGHKRWLAGEGGGHRADLSWANLSGANLSWANLSRASLSEAYLSRASLSEADLSGASLSGAYLSRASLSGANLSGASLSGAYLSRASLSGANLSEAYLSRANLSEAYLSRANLSEADLSGANLSEADLSGASLSGANLSGANLSGASLSGANLSEADLVALYSVRRIVPEEGAFIAFKKLLGGAVATLEIPADALRVGGLVGRKCRASKAVVRRIDGPPPFQSHYHNAVVYSVGMTIEPRTQFNPDPCIECASGIHFFMSRKEAEDYVF